MNKFPLNITLILFIVLVSVGCSSVTKKPSGAAVVNSGERMIAYTSTIHYEVADVDATRISITDSVKQYEGIIVQETNSYLVVRIPINKYDQFIKTIGSINRIVKSEMYGEDITDVYEDIVLKLESKIKLRERYLLLLNRAERIEDILSIERELERINIEIQSLEGKKNESEKKVEYIKLNIYINKKVMPGPLGWIFYLGYKAIEWLFVWK